MNPKILHPEVQEYIEMHFSENLSKLILKGSPFPEVSTTDLAHQLEGKKKAQRKLPSWFNSKNILYPPSVHLEQSSSEITAAYKSSQISGQTIIDLTGGFGVDILYLSKTFDKALHCEENLDLSEIVRHNFQSMEVRNVEILSGNGLDILAEREEDFDWIYLDPSRRNDTGGKVFLLSDCEPDVPRNLEILWKKTKRILIKTSPLLDLSAGISELNHVKSIHIISVENEVKELLWFLEKDYSSEIEVKAVNISKKMESFYADYFHRSYETAYSYPLSFLYEPGAALMKSGLFSSLSFHLKLNKLHPHSHLFTSESRQDFQGRKFEVLEVIPYKKQNFKKLKERKVNITVRNFPLSVKHLRKKFKLRDGGEEYWFFTTLMDDQKAVIRCKKLI